MKRLRVTSSGNQPGMYGMLYAVAIRTNQNRVGDIQELDDKYIFDSRKATDLLLFPEDKDSNHPILIIRNTDRLKNFQKLNEFSYNGKTFPREAFELQSDSGESQ